MRFAWLSIAVFCGGSFTMAGRVDACSPPYCTSERIIPREPSQASVPANLQALIWHAPQPFGHEQNEWTSDSIVFADSSGRRLPVTVSSLGPAFVVGFEIGFVSALQPNTDYTMEAPSLCPTSTAAVFLSFRTEESAPLPTRLGNLMIQTPSRKTVELSTALGSCTEPVDVIAVRLAVDLSPEAERWRHALVWQTLIDGYVWQPARHPFWPPFGQSDLGPGEDEVFVVCTPAHWSTSVPTLGLGRHSVVMQARLPGSDRVLASDAREIDLRCDPKTPLDGGVVDGADSGLRGEGLEADSGGCACRGHRSRSSLTWLWLGLGLLLRRRRRLSRDESVGSLE